MTCQPQAGWTTEILTISFRACIDDALRVMGEACKIYAVLLTFEFLGVLPLHTVVYLQSLVIPSDKR